MSGVETPASLDVLPAFVPQSALSQRVAAMLHDPRDVPFVSLIVQCISWQLLGVSLFFVGPLVLYLAPLYWAVWGLGFVDRFILMLHCTSHRNLFRNRTLNYIIPWVVGPFYGQTPESYFAHHMGMHHSENNLQDDLSSTMKYDRSQFSGWLHYYLTFMFRGFPDLMNYHRKHGNKKLLRRLMMGEVSFWGAMLVLGLLNWQATLVVFVFPVLLVRTLMMAGNWGQHAFVDAADPGNPYLNSLTCINLRYNRRCFNDGYHILHHIKPRTHYTEYAAEFVANQAEYGCQDAVVLEGIDFFQVWALLMVGAWKTLARHFVHLPGAPQRNQEEVIAFLKQRTKAIPVS